MPLNKFYLNMFKPRDWFKIYNKADGSGKEILIYDQIGADFWGDGMTPADFLTQLRAIEKEYDSVDIRINSPGGFIHDGFTIYNHIFQSKLKTRGFNDGLAASAASFILMACDEVYMPPNAEFMIHPGQSIAIGDADVMMEEANHLNRLDFMIANIYAKKTGMTEDEVLALMKKETWMDGNEAVELGFVDSLMEESKAAACAFDLDLLNGLPADFINYQNALKKRIQENTLRDAGLSRSEAKAKLNNQREAENNVNSDIEQQAQQLINKEIEKCLVNL